MCGIAGYLSNSQSPLSPDDSALGILAAMKSRGPDASGAWTHRDSKVLLLHTRLSIQDLTDTGSQPMHSCDGKLTIVFSGEIYNKEELRQLVPEYPFRGTSDTEVILTLYQKFGTDMPGLLRGMFAFAIWDEQRQSLFLARDPYGIKPLYLADTSDGLWFASQVKALLRAPAIGRVADPAGHVSFFLWGHVTEPYTLYRGIRSLRSGHCLWLERGRPPKEWKFASVAEAFAAGLNRAPSVPLSEALTDSVRSHFLSDVPVSVFLSAGLDSSTILALAADSFPAASLHSLTLGFDAYSGTENDETHEATQIASHFGVPQHVQIISRSDFDRETERFLEAMDQPSIDGINTYFIAKMAKEAGFKVSLSGIGGDELFAGYPSFQEIPKLVKRTKFFPRKVGVAMRKVLDPLLRPLTSPKYAGLFEYGGTITGSYMLRRALYMPWELPGVMDQEFAAQGLYTLFDSQYEQEELRKVSALSPRAQISYLESAQYMRNRLLRDADWAGMAHSIEIRTPLVDFTLLSTLAPAICSSHPPGKLDMATSPRKPLPSSILLRKKTGFSVPVREWMMESTNQNTERGHRPWAGFLCRKLWAGPAPHLKSSA